MVPPSTKERAESLVKIGSNKEVIESSIETEGEETENKILYVGIVQV